MKRAISIHLHVWLILGGLIAVILTSNPYAILPAHGDRTEQKRADFLAFYSAGTLMREDPAKLYDEPSQARAQAEAFGTPITPDGPGFMPFVYPTIVAILFVPIALLPYAQAYLVIMAANVVLWGLAVHLLCQRFNVPKDSAILLALSTSISFPAIITVLNGQLSFLSFILAALAIADIREGNPRSGLWIGLLAFKLSALLISAALLILFLWRIPKTDAAYAALLVGMVLFNRHVHFPDLVLLWIPAILLFSDGNDAGTAARCSVFAISLLSTLAIFTMPVQAVPFLTLILIGVFLLLIFGGTSQKVVDNRGADFLHSRWP